MFDLPNSAVIRQFLFDSFNDEDLESLCFDHFPHVYSNFTAGMPKDQKIQRLLAYCRSHDKFHDLHEAIHAARPGQYGDFLQALEAARQAQQAKHEKRVQDIREKMWAAVAQVRRLLRYAWVAVPVILLLIGTWSLWQHDPVLSAVPTPTSTPTATPSPTLALTPTPSPTLTISPTQSHTLSPTPSYTPTVTASPTGTPTFTPTSTRILTLTSTATWTPPRSPTNTPTLPPAPTIDKVDKQPTPDKADPPIKK